VNDPPSDQPGMNSTSITLDNVIFKGVTNAIVDTTGKTWLPGSVGSVDTFVLGPDYDGLNRQFTFGKQFTTPRLPGLTVPILNGFPKPIYFENSRKQYENVPASQFISVKKNGAKGDGVSDDTAALQSIINRYAGSSNILYFNSGSYVVTNTIYIPGGTKIVGELWAQLVAKVS
jgi:Pectate lyase superfamily protein